MDPPLSVVVARGGVVESRHRAHAVAVRRGEVERAAGDRELVTFMRSAAKPLQALPLALEEPDLPEEELAIACASHDATDEQLAAVRSLLARAGAVEENLECGAEAGLRVRHNCSGKHSAMLLRSKRHGWPLPGYRLPGHPAQEEALRVVAAAAGLDPADVPAATDGCGVVTFALPLRTIAVAFARLAACELAGAERVVATMRARPDLVGGPGAADTALMRAIPGAIAKRGAEGLLCVGLANGTGIAVKVEDGANRAALPAAAAFLGVEELREAPLRNSRGDLVGAVRAPAAENPLPPFPRSGIRSGLA